MKRSVLRTTTIALALTVLGTARAWGQPGEIQLDEEPQGEGWTLHVAAIHRDLQGDELVGSGSGAEVQIRYDTGRFSTGFGIEFSRHDVDVPDEPDSDLEVDLIGIFLEPRVELPFGGRRLAPYVSGRIGVSDQEKSGSGPVEIEGRISEPGVSFNAGGGVRLRAIPRLSLDLGLTYGYADFGESRTGRNVVAKAGVVFDL